MPTFAERIALRSRTVTIAGLAVLALLAWAYLLSGAGMPAMADMAAAPSFIAVAAMWSVMMVAMMIPAAAPTILLYAHVHRQSTGLESTPPTAAFLAGYLACWLGFALIAAGLQFWVASPVPLVLANRDAAGGIVVAAGIYQLSPLKDACLSRCRSPGLFMVLLFVGGVMNLVWVAGLTLLIAAEKLLPGGTWLVRIAGVAMIIWGTSLILD